MSGKATTCTVHRAILCTLLNNTATSCIHRMHNSLESLNRKVCLAVFKKTMAEEPVLEF